MDRKMLVMLISAGTDFIIAAGTALTAAMVAKGDAMLPSYPVILLAVVGGLIAFARTVQQAVRKDDSTVATTTTTISTPTKEQ